jgi:hypothetical protein
MEEQDHIWNLVARKLAGEATEEELNELEDLLARYPDMTFVTEALTNLWTEGQSTENRYARQIPRLTPVYLEKQSQETQLAPTPACSQWYVAKLP